MNIKKIFSELGLTALNKGDIKSYSPIDGSLIGSVQSDSKESYNKKIKASVDAFKILQDIPAPKRGELMRIFGDELRKVKEPLGKLVTIECGKIYEEGLGEVQEMIDICDFALGLSRTISGLTLPSERSQHSMQENWLPLGVIGVISAFNFPVAVWAWNFCLGVVCGNSVVWKPSEKTPIVALACQHIFNKALARFTKETGIKLPQVCEIICGNYKIGEQLVNDKRIPLISATGSTKMGRIVAEQVGKRLGRSLLELGGNNAVIVTPSADLNITLPSILFGAVGTTGQRCTSTRRVLVHESIYENVFGKIQNAFSSLKSKIGDPLVEGTLIGPLLDKDAYENMQNTIKEIKKSGAKVIGGERILQNKFPNAYYVNPALVKLKKQIEIVEKETFAPLLYVLPYKTLEQAIEMNNSVPQGLSSAIFTNDLREAEIFKKYSDCGITNVNIGTSGAEIGGAFGGEKETGGGRESGSDSWKSYMRRQTSTTYYGLSAPELAQGVKFTA